MVEFTLRIELQLLEENESEQWDKMVETSPHGTIFHTWKFLNLIEKHTDTKLYPIIGYKETKAIGIFPIFFQKKFFYRAVFSPPPHSAVPYLGPLIIDYDSLKPYERESNFIRFQKKIDEFISEELKPNYVTVVSPPYLLDVRPLIWTNYEVSPRYNYIIDLTKGEEYLWTRFQKNLREGLTRTERRGVVVEESGEEGLNFIYDNYCRRYKEQNRKPPISRDYLIEVFKSYHPGNLRVFISRFNREPIGGTINLCYNHNFASWIGSAKTNISGLSANDLTQWECIKWAYRNKFEIYEEIGANTERLWQFKSKYNPEISMCFNAKRYSSIYYKWIEIGYRRIKLKLKP